MMERDLQEEARNWGQGHKLAFNLRAWNKEGHGRGGGWSMRSITKMPLVPV